MPVQILHFKKIIRIRAQGGQKNVLDPLELELQATVSCSMWLLGTELGSSQRAVNVLRHCHLRSPLVPKC